MRERGTGGLIVVDDVDHAAIGELGDRQVRNSVDDAVGFHCLGEGAKLRQELYACLGFLAVVDIAAGDGHRIYLAVRAAKRTDVALAPAKAVPVRKKELFTRGLPPTRALDNLRDVPSLRCADRLR